MAESLGSDLESDASSVDGGPTSMAWSQTSTAAREQLVKRMESLQQENRVLRMELDTFRYKCKSLEEENRELKKARVTIVSIARNTDLRLADSKT
jgi:coiled-coil domain-containing protein 6